MENFKSQGKYSPRSATFTVAHHYWINQFKRTIMKARGQNPDVLVEEAA